MQKPCSTAFPKGGDIPEAPPLALQKQIWYTITQLHLW